MDSSWNRGRINSLMTITKYTFFSPNGNDFPITSNADAKLYMMLAGMNKGDLRIKHWTHPLDTALNRVYINSSIIVGGRYFELENHAISLRTTTTNFVHAVIDLSNELDPVSITVEDTNNSNLIDINNDSGILKVCFDVIVTNETSVISSKTPSQITNVENINVSGILEMGKTAAINIDVGYGHIVRFTRMGNLVYVNSSNRFTSVPPVNRWNSPGITLPVGFRPTDTVNVFSRALDGTGAQVWNEIGSSGNIRTFINPTLNVNTYYLTPPQMWITTEQFPT